MNARQTKPVNARTGCSAPDEARPQTAHGRDFSESVPGLPTAARSERQFLYRLALTVNVLLITNYLLWAVAPPSRGAAILLIGLLCLACAGMLRDLKRTFPILLFLGLGFVITLGTETTHWDARSIWLFHGKRIFVDKSLYTLLDNYMPVTHNDYPVLYPALAATAAQAVGLWNEIFPKSVVCFLYTAPMLVLCTRFRHAAWTGLFVMLAMILGQRFIFNGYADAFLSVYIAAAIVLLTRAPSEPSADKRLLAALAATTVAVTVLLKNEGLAAAVVITGCAVFLHKESRRLSLLCFAVAAALYLVTWKVPLMRAALENDLAASGAVERILARLGNGSELSAVAVAVARKIWPWVGLFVAGVLVMRPPRQEYLLTLLFSAGYAGLLFLVYLSSPHPLDWHLSTSVFRTTLPINMACVATLIGLVANRTDAAHALVPGEDEKE